MGPVSKLSRLLGDGNPWNGEGEGEAAGRGTNVGDAAHCSGVWFLAGVLCGCSGLPACWLGGVSGTVGAGVVGGVIGLVGLAGIWTGLGRLAGLAGMAGLALGVGVNLRKNFLFLSEMRPLPSKRT